MSRAEEGENQMFFNAIYALALAASAPAPAATAPAAQPAQQQRVTAALLTERMRPHLPRAFNQGAQLVAVRAEGETVVMTVDVPEEWLDEGIATFERFFLMGLCSERENIFFDNGISVRIDTFTSARREPRAGNVLNACPAAS